MKKLLLTMAILSQVVLNVNAQDLSATIDQSTFDKITGAMQVPLTLVEKRNPFKSNSLDESEQFDYREDDETFITFTDDESKEMFSWALSNDKSDEEIQDVYKEALRQEWEEIIKQIDDILTEVSNAKKNDPNVKISFEGFDQEDLEKIRDAPFEEAYAELKKMDKSALGLKAHLAYLRVDLTDRPQFQVTSPMFKLNNLKVKTTATGQLWAKIPQFHCCRRVLGICVCVRVKWKWKKIASLTVSPKVAAAAQINLFENSSIVYARAKFNKLALDYNILRKFNLAFIANLSLEKKLFALYNAQTYIATIPYLNTNFGIESIKLPANPSGVTVEINVKEKTKE